MAQLSTDDRFNTWAELMRSFSDRREPISITKIELRAVVDAMDTWLNDNASVLNAALPQPGRAALTAQQKALILMFVIQKRYLTGA